MVRDRDEDRDALADGFVEDVEHPADRARRGSSGSMSSMRVVVARAAKHATSAPNSPGCHSGCRAVQRQSPSVSSSMGGHYNRRAQLAGYRSRLASWVWRPRHALASRLMESGDTPKRDISGVVAPPPLIFLAGLAVGFGLEALLPGSHRCPTAVRVDPRRRSAAGGARAAVLVRARVHSEEDARGSMEARRPQSSPTGPTGSPAIPPTWAWRSCTSASPCAPRRCGCSCRCRSCSRSSTAV